MCLLQWFEQKASAVPDGLAIAGDSRRVSYRQLNRLAEQIAHELKTAGVAQGTLVGVLLDRSPEMVAGLLGIWKAGGAYVPLDPAAPPERWMLLIQDATPSVVLSQRRFHASLGHCAALILDLEDLCAGPRDSAAPEAIACPITPDSLAYVIYTSGSTGKPKGARITHRSLANTLEAVGRDLALQAEDIVLAWSTISFDVACLELYLPLACGASIYLGEQDPAGSGSRVQQLLGSRATVMLGTPTMYRLLLEEGWQGGGNMQLIVGGEVLPLALARNLAGRCRALWNQYGPTETAICATRERIDVSVEKVTIGRPLPNVQVHLLDKDLHPVPQGSIGEIFIGGVGVARGYLNRPQLTRACFMLDPFAEGNQGLLYKTGDLAIQLGDGRFDFLGRVDGQVKIRGFRVETGEVESALMQCSGVQAAVVRAIELDLGDPRLVAFVISAESHLEKAWRKSLGRQLPVYMVPSEFVILRHFPATPSGKVDLQALDALRRKAGKSASSPPVSPVDPVEVWLRARWEKLLKVRAVGIHDDFFALGGHSLLAARLLVQIEQRFGGKLPHSVLVEHPTIYGLAAYLRRKPTSHWPALVTIQGGAQLPPLFVAHGVGGSLLSFKELAVQLGPERPVYGLQMPALIEQHQAELAALAANYLRQLRTLQPSGPYHLAGHSSGGLVVYEMACQLCEQGETVGLLALLDCDPETGKPARQPCGGSLKISLQRAQFRLRELGWKELLRRRMIYEKLKMRAWQAARARRAGKAGGPVPAEGYLALAFRECTLKTYSGDATLFIAGNEAPSPVPPVSAWKRRILGACEMRTIPGNHMTMLTHPQVISLAQEMAQRMASREPVSVLA
jgi:amino acid adenylation domain-containing protein